MFVCDQNFCIAGNRSSYSFRFLIWNPVKKMIWNNYSLHIHAFLHRRLSVFVIGQIKNFGSSCNRLAHLIFFSVLKMSVPALACFFTNIIFETNWKIKINVATVAQTHILFEKKIISSCSVPCHIHKCAN